MKKKAKDDVRAKRCELLCLELEDLLRDAMLALTKEGGLGTASRSLEKLSGKLSQGTDLLRILPRLDDLLGMLGQCAREIRSVYLAELLEIHLFVRKHQFQYFNPSYPPIKEIRPRINELARICELMSLEYEYHMPHEEKLHYPQIPVSGHADVRSDVPGMDPWILARTIRPISPLKEALASGSDRNGANPDALSYTWLEALLGADEDDYFHVRDLSATPTAYKANETPERLTNTLPLMPQHHRLYRQLRTDLADLLYTAAKLAAPLKPSLEKDCRELGEQVDQADAVANAPEFVKRLKNTIAACWQELVVRSPSANGRKGDGSARRGPRTTRAQDEQAEIGAQLVSEGRMTSNRAAAIHVLKVIAPENPIKWNSGYPNSEAGVEALRKAISRRLPEENPVPSAQPQPPTASQPRP